MHITRHILRTSPVVSSPRLSQVLGMFDVPPTSTSAMEWNIDITFPPKWNIGVIVGPSGSGKSTIARELFGPHIAGDFGWPANRSIVDAFPAALPVKSIVGLLSSVGFSSPPAWVRPFGCLSTGQQFRVSLARTLAEAMVDKQLRVVDEYSSVVDRTTARIGSAAVARTVRRRELQFIAVTCHYDILDWLEPDWVYEPHLNSLHVEPTHSSGSDDSARGSLRRRYFRPKLELEIIRAGRPAWPLFKPHHYLNADLNRSASCYLGLVDNKPAAFTAVLPFPHPTHWGYREHRLVVLPDCQGIGIGNAMSEFVASLYRATGRPYTSTTSHPAMIYHRAASPLWRMTRKPGLCKPSRNRSGLMRKTMAIDRLTAGFAYVGPSRAEEAGEFGINTFPPSPANERQDSQSTWRTDQA